MRWLLLLLLTVPCVAQQSEVYMTDSTLHSLLWKQLTDEPLYHCIPNWDSYSYDDINKHPGWSCYLPNTLISIEGVGDTDLVTFRFEGGTPGDIFLIEQSGFAHKFWDTPNILLHSLNTASKIADYHSTERLLRRGGHELNPLLQTRARRVGYVYGFGVGGHILIAWLFHKTNHHKLERWFLIPSASASMVSASRNYARF